MYVYAIQNARREVGKGGGGRGGNLHKGIIRASQLLKLRFKCDGHIFISISKLQNLDPEKMYSKCLFIVDVH